MSKKIIVGNTIATPVAASDWSQTDETKIDYIKNKPTLGTLAAKDRVSKADLESDIIESIDEIKSTIQPIYTIPYYSPSTITETQKVEIREIITEIAAEKADYALFMRVNNGIIPASYIEDSRNKTIRATLHDINNRTYQIVLSKAGEVTVSQETIYIMDQEKIESASTKAVVGSVMAGYVQDYVAEHGGVHEGDIPVTSVNGKIGDVNLSAEDVGALPADVTKLPNPYAITFTGAATGTYDGSGALEIHIPEGGDKVPTDDETLELIIEMGLVDPVTSDDGEIYIDENNIIYTL